MDEWPWGLLTPRKDQWRLKGVALGGGVVVAGAASTTRTDGGGLWVGEQEIEVDGRKAIKAIRALEAILDGGLGRMVVWSHEEPFVPEGLAFEASPHSDDSPFSDDGLYLTAPPGAEITEAAALRATVLSYAMLPGIGPLEGGEHFSIRHPNKGIRRYEVKRVGDGEMQIRPPLREAVPAETPLDFLRVGCVCALANPDSFLDAFDAQRGQDTLIATAQWVEVF